PKDTLAFSLTNAPSGGVLNPIPVLKWKPTSSQLGNNSFTARVQDNKGNSDSKSFTVNVVNTNGAPLFDPQPDETISRGINFSRMLNALDPNPNDTLTYSLISGPIGMTLIPAQRLSWTPTNSQLGDFLVRVRVTDPAGLNAFAQFTITVKNTLPPTAVDDRYEISLGQTLTVPAPGVLTNDINPNPGLLTAAKLSDPDKGSASLSSNGALGFVAPSLPTGPILDVTRRAAGPGQIVDYNLSAPILADFTGDGKPEVIWFNGNSLMVNRGDNGALLFIATRPPSAQTLGLSCQIGNGNKMGPVAADIDDDGIVEIVTSAACLGDPGLGALNNTTAERLIALVYDSTAVEGYRVKWISANRLAQSSNGNGIGVGSMANSAFTVARLRPTDKPMILFGSNFPNGLGGRCADVRPGSTDAVCRFVFAVNTADGSLNRIYYTSHPFLVPSHQYSLSDGYMAPVVADVDNDGALEILYQGTLWNLDGTVKRQFDGFDVAGGNGVTYSMPLDVDGDPEMEIITQYVDADISFTSRQATGIGYLKAFKANGTLLWTLGIPVPPSNVTAMTAADVDRDGSPEIIFAIYQSIWVVDSRTGQIRYIKSLVTSDPASAAFDVARGAPTFPVYDLNGDGILDMVVQWGASTVRILRADNGADQTLFTYPGNATYSRFSDGRPQPVIADTDGSGQASIVWIHDVNLNGHSNLQVITGNTVPWRSAPANYNQQAFWGSNFNANGSIPLTYPRHTTNPRTNIFRNQPAAPYPSGFTGTEQTRFTYSASSDGLSSAPANVVIDIARNRKPQFTSIPPSVKIGNQELVYLATAVDPDPGDTITYGLAARFGPNASDCCSQIVVDSAPIGTVLSQSPSANATLPQTERVNVTVSKGLAPIAVPNVVSQVSTSATTTLASLGFTAAITNVYSDTVDQGEVISQVPAAGTVATPPGPVALNVSAGNGLSLRLSRAFTTADVAIPFTIAATDLNGVDIAPPPMTFAVSVLRTPTAGPLPSVAGNSVVPGITTLGLFRLTGTHTPTGRVVFADFAVSEPRPATGPSMNDDYVKLTEAMADIDVLIRQGKAALAANNEPLVRSLLTQMVTRWRQVNLSDLKFDSPFALGTDFFPTPDQYASFGGSPTPDDQLLAQIRADSIADLKEWTDALLAPGTPLSTLRALAVKFSTRAARANGLVASESGLIQDQAAITVLLSRRLPGLYDALMSEIARSLSIPPAIQPLSAEPFTENEQSAASPKAPIRKESTLAEVLTTQAMQYVVDTMIDNFNKKYAAAKQYTTEIIGQAKYAGAVVAITQHLRQILHAQRLEGVVSGASLSFRVFEAPYSMIEANVEKTYPELNQVVVIGPELISTGPVNAVI
ncbi:MAG: FG-GAP-like repeat-containing protein, partial [Acidobacteria bacterium]|nr:FG-GAP-like repeat-containing protein [Acidobacteriota bacterium]